MIRNVIFLLLVLYLCWSCASVDVTRLQPDILKAPKGTEPIAAIQARMIGFYFATFGMPNVTLDRTINDLLAKKAREIGATRLIDLRFEETPHHGVWWLLKLLGFRSASASAIALISTDAEFPAYDPFNTEDKSTDAPLQNNDQ